MQVTKIAVPRLASTVLLLANSQDLGLWSHSPLLDRALLKPNDIHVLMVRRHSKARFMPEMYVFPGGGVDVEDGAVVEELGFLPKANTTNAADAKDRSVLWNAWRSRVAALRELSEETACVLHANSTITSLAEWQGSAAGKSSGRVYDATAAPLLTPLGRWVTPEDYKYRYDTFFFGAALRATDQCDSTAGQRLPPQLVQLQGQEREISNMLWVSPLEALVRHETPSEAFTLPPPTFHLLSALARMPSLDSLASQWQQRRAQTAATQSTTPEEVDFDPVTPGSRSTNEGRDVEYFQIPEHAFHNMGACGSLPSGHYSMPHGPAKDGKSTQYVDLYVGDERVLRHPAKRLTTLKE